VGNIYKAYDVTLMTYYPKIGSKLENHTLVPQTLYQKYRNSLVKEIIKNGSVSGYCEKDKLGKVNFIHYGIAIEVVSKDGALHFQIGKRGLAHDKDNIVGSVQIKDTAYAWTMFAFGYGYSETRENDPYARKTLVIGEDQNYRIHAIQHFHKYSAAMNAVFGDVDDLYMLQTKNFAYYRRPSFIVEDKNSRRFYKDCSLDAGNVSEYETYSYKYKN